MPRSRPRTPAAALALATLLLVPVATAAPPIGPVLHRPVPPPERPAPEAPAPPPSITTRDAAGRVVLLDAGVEEAAVRALDLDPSARARLDSAIDRHRAELTRLAVDHLDPVLRTLLPARARAADLSASELQHLLVAAASLNPPSLLARLEREGVLTLQQRQLAQAAADDYRLAATEDATLAAVGRGLEAVVAANLRTDFLLATGELAGVMDRLLLAAADRWPLLEPGLPITRPQRQTLAAAVAPALDRSSPPAARAGAMALALAGLNPEVAAAALRAASPDQFVPERPQRLPTPLTRPE